MRQSKLPQGLYESAEQMVRRQRQTRNKMVAVIIVALVVVAVVVIYVLLHELNWFIGG